jgi:photosystem II stability/assembly factor-like uncharacterized protein
MKRVAILSFLVLVTLVGTSPSASASSLTTHRAFTPHGHDLSLPVGAAQAAFQGSAAPRLDTGTATVAGLACRSIFAYPLGGEPIQWWVPIADGWQSGQGTTASDGTFSLTGLPDITGAGEVYVRSFDGSWAGRTGLTWTAAGGTTELPLTCDTLSLDLQRGGPWSDWSSPSVVVVGADGISSLRASQSFSGVTASPTPQVALSIVRGRYSAGTVNFWANEGVEFTGDALTSFTEWDRIADIEFTDPLDGWVTSESYIYSTTDGGATWNGMQPGSFLNLADTDFADTSHGMVVNSGYPSSILHTDDGGSTWSSTAMSTSCSHLAYQDTTHAWAVGDLGSIVFSDDGGSTWADEVSGTTETLYGVSFVTDLDGWAVGSSGTILHTSDGGTQWVAQASGTTESLNSVQFVDADNGWACGADGTVLRTSDGGQHWDSLVGVTDYCFSVWVRSPSDVWVVSFSGIWHTIDSGTTWAAADVGIPFGSPPAVLAASDATHLWFGSWYNLIDSHDDGQTWTSMHMTASEADAQRVSLVAPRYASGGPGTKVKLTGQKFPSGWTLDLTGTSDYPATAPVTSYGSVGADSAFPRTVAVPRTATPGYFYLIDARHQGGLLDLTTAFEVATLKSTRTTIAKGRSVRLSGVVPVQGHLGTTPGKRKYVAVFQRTTAAGQPTVPDPTKKGWKFVKVLKTNGFGKYQTALLRPRKTTWYVVMFDSDDWYWGGYTSVIKVAVHEGDRETAAGRTPRRRFTRPG